MILMVKDGKMSARSIAPVEIMLHIRPVSGDGSSGSVALSYKTKYKLLIIN